MVILSDALRIQAIETKKQEMDQIEALERALFQNTPNMLQIDPNGSMKFIESSRQPFSNEVSFRSLNFNTMSED